MVEVVPDRARVVACYADALEAIRDLCSMVPRWDASTPCGEWTLLGLSGHLVVIARYWHRLLDAAEAGQPLVGLPRGRQLAEMNARDLLDLGDFAGPERVGLFLESASAHLRRIDTADWQLVVGEWPGLGALTVGQHCGVAVGEWHVHAWDIARSIGADHRPTDAKIVAEGNRVVRAVSDRGDPWLAVLSAYGRDPAWTTSQG